MKIVTHSLDQISGLDILASGSLIVFFLLFLWIIYRIVRTNKNEAKQWGNMPLDIDDQKAELNTNESTNGY